MIPCGSLALLKRGSWTFTIYRWFSHLDPPLIGGFSRPGLIAYRVSQEQWSFESPIPTNQKGTSVIFSNYIYLLGFHPPWGEKNINMSDLGSCFFFFNHHPKTGNINPLSLWPVARPTPTLRLPGTVRQNQHGSSGQEQWNWLRGSRPPGPPRCIQHGTRRFGPPKKMT